jgi:hypothetical protein
MIPTPEQKAAVQYYLGEHFGLNASQLEALTDDVILRISEGLGTEAEIDNADLTVVSHDDELNALVTSQGEIVCILDAPYGDVERRAMLEWMGERRQGALAQMEGVKAEKQHWTDTIGKRYDPKINKLKRYAEYLEWRFAPLAQGYLDELREDAKKKKQKDFKSITIGLLSFGYTSTRESTAIIDVRKAFEFCRKRFSDAIKIEVLVSKIPSDVRRALTKDDGFDYYPGGEDKFGFKK